MYQEGDKVKIRSWKSMENEYGVDDIGDIYIDSCFIWFVSKMKTFCGRVMAIRLISPGNKYALRGVSEWYFSKEMFDPRFINGGENGEL